MHIKLCFNEGGIPVQYDTHYRHAHLVLCDYRKLRDLPTLVSNLRLVFLYREHYYDNFTISNIPS